MRSSAFPFGTTVYCDDVRQETGHKLSFMGIYKGNIIIPKEAPLPILLPKMCACVLWHEDVNDLPDELTFRLVFRDAVDDSITEIQSIPVDVKEMVEIHKPTAGTPQNPRHFHLSPIFILVPFQISKVGILGVRVERRGETWRAGGVEIMRATEDGND